MEFREESKGVLQKKNPPQEGQEVVYYNECCASLSRMEALSEEERKTGVITRQIPDDAVNFKVSFENKYGIWTHTMIRIR